MDPVFGNLGKEIAIQANGKMEKFKVMVFILALLGKDMKEILKTF